MKTEINWNNIRPLSSVNDGFEELVCQLARRGRPEGGTIFARAGKPDAGKECYWLTDKNEMIAWQAKYFLNSPTPGQWKQIDESVRKAIDRHSNLSHYIVAMPADLPDAKPLKGTAALDKWKEWVTKWSSIAAAKGMTVTFEFWGASELMERLMLRENEGLAYFWFRKEFLTDDWFDKKNQESIDGLGVRYSPELNVELELSQMFEGLSRSAKFRSHTDRLYRNIFNKSRFTLRDTDQELKKLNDHLKEKLSHLPTYYHGLDLDTDKIIDDEGFLDNLDAARDCTGELLDRLFALRAEKEKGSVETYNRPYATEISDVSTLRRALGDLSDFFDGPTMTLAKEPFLLLIGEAGIGKSHLLADAVRSRSQAGRVSLFLLGENFVEPTNPWNQLLSGQLRKSDIDEYIFLDALNAKAESRGERIIIFIDALNEGRGREIWSKHMVSFAKEIRRYPNLGLVVSVRDSYVDLIAPSAAVPDSLLLRIEHFGFANLEYEATRRFFAHYGITQPATPILNPEFSNPLFLKLFCKSLRDQGLTVIPEGYGGLTSILENFLKSVNDKLSRPDILDFDPKLKLVQKAVDKVVLKMVKSESDFLEYDAAEKIVSKVFREKSARTEPFLQRLVSEGVFNVDLHWEQNSKHREVVFLGYQRFQDHMIVNSLLEAQLDIAAPETSFTKGRLAEITKDESALRHSRNLVEALTIQLPERTGREIFEILPQFKSSPTLAQSWIKSLIWRKPNLIGESAVKYVDEVLIRNPNFYGSFLSMAINSCMKTDFLFNSDSIHRWLVKMPMPKRDRIWTIWIHDKFGEEDSRTAISRLIEWAWDERDKRHLSGDAVLMACTTLGWFCTSCNRHLRDGATKAMVCLLTDRLDIAGRLLEKFKDVNDPYVLDRIVAAGYGATIRSKFIAGQPELMQAAYLAIFDREKVTPHILTRDYARQIIELGIRSGIAFSGNPSKIHPPYVSEPLPRKLPTNNDIDKKYRPKEKAGNYGGKHYGATAILSSMTTEYGRGTGGYGDFGRYTFESAFRHWPINADGLSNLAVQRIFEMGYDPELFSEFDSKQEGGRHSSHRERMGKKYQWIAFYELLGRVSDQVQLYSSEGLAKKRKIPYEGPWYPYVRDIDPTFIIKETRPEPDGSEKSDWWAFQHQLVNTQSHEEWMNSIADLPSMQDLIQVVDPEGTEWLWLNGNPKWLEKLPLEAEDFAYPQKRLEFWIDAFVVRKNQKKNLLETVRSGFMADIPEVRHLHQIFSREYYHSPAFSFFQKPYYSGLEWAELYSNRKLAGKVQRTSEYFLWEEEFDCSKNETIAYFKPSKLIFEGLGLRLTDREGTLCDDTGKIICFDPSVYHKSFRGLLVRKGELLTFLKENRLDIVWRIGGEKLLLGNFRQLKGRGRLTIEGFYEMQRDMIVGSFKTDLESKKNNGHF